MKYFLQMFKTEVYKQRFALGALLLAIGGWVLFAELVPRGILDGIVYALVGWYWLGRVMVPWIERKLEELFG